VATLVGPVTYRADSSLAGGHAPHVVIIVDDLAGPADCVSAFCKSRVHPIAYLLSPSNLEGDTSNLVEGDTTTLGSQLRWRSQHSRIIYQG
jgi:hypothetical protein